MPQQCLNITEFHEPGQPISTIHASDADDPQTPNGQVRNIIDFSILFITDTWIILVVLICLAG